MCNVEDQVGEYQCAQVTYTGNSKTAIKDELWKNWNCIMVKKKPQAKPKATKKKITAKKSKAKRAKKRKQATGASSANEEPDASPGVSSYAKWAYVF